MTIIFATLRIRVALSKSVKINFGLPSKNTLNLLKILKYKNKAKIQKKLIYSADFHVIQTKLHRYLKNFKIK